MQRLGGVVVEGRLRVGLHPVLSLLPAFGHVDVSVGPSVLYGVHLVPYYTVAWRVYAKVKGSAPARQLEGRTVQQPCLEPHVLAGLIYILARKKVYEVTL